MDGDIFVKSPAFQIYPADFLADKNTLVMSAAEVGAYWLLICVCWRENGLPDDVDELADLARTPAKQFQVSWDKHIQRCFLKREDGKWTHNRLQKERDKQTANREKRQVAGGKGADKRWQKDSNAITETQPEIDNGDGKRVPDDGLSDCSFQSSISSSSSTTSSEGKRSRPQKTRDARLDHPALQAVFKIKGKYPSKDVWDLIIETVGEEPDAERLRECWVKWRGKGFNSENYGWMTDWYVSGVQGSNGAAPSKVEQSINATQRFIQRKEAEIAARDGN